MNIEIIIKLKILNISSNSEIESSLKAVSSVSSFNEKEGKMRPVFDASKNILAFWGVF